MWLLIAAVLFGAGIWLGWRAARVNQNVAADIRAAEIDSEADRAERGLYARWLMREAA